MFKKIRSIIRAIRIYGILSCFRNYFSILTSNVCVVSFQKSGQIWTIMMFGKVISLKYGIHDVGKGLVKKIKLDTVLMTLFKPIPTVLFTHAGSTSNEDSLDYVKMLKKKRIVLLVRDPRDEIVSLYHDHTKRNLWYKSNVSDFVRDPDWGLKKVIKFMNLWAEEMDKRKDDFSLLRYEDMKKETPKELKKFLAFLKIEVDDSIIDEAIKYGSFENMRKMELAKEFKDPRMLPHNVNDLNSYRTRKGKVGSHKEELNKEDIEYINKEIKEKLNPVFGYNTVKQ